MPQGEEVSCPKVLLPVLLGILVAQDEKRELHGYRVRGVLGQRAGISWQESGVQALPHCRNSTNVCPKSEN